MLALHSLIRFKRSVLAPYAATWIFSPSAFVTRKRVLSC
jgi:hypothetical protein